MKLPASEVHHSVTTRHHSHHGRLGSASLRTAMRREFRARRHVLGPKPRQLQRPRHPQSPWRAMAGHGGPCGPGTKEMRSGPNTVCTVRCQDVPGCARMCHGCPEARLKMLRSCFYSLGSPLAVLHAFQPLPSLHFRAGVEVGGSCATEPVKHLS